MGVEYVKLCHRDLLNENVVSREIAASECASKRLMPDASHIAEEFSQRGTEFLKIELQTGLTLAKIAVDKEPGTQERQKSQANARKAYDTVLRLRRRIGIYGKQNESEIEELLKRLRSALERLGESFKAG